ncbi:GNAT family N-acetyltransferase [Jannaschia seohaensis]|uniref:Protein N-acetyltransferase, RimJ/RimL family n=1 Tax=Jannaschia seohaensis TaxID=475081 RepID=A0A2Y9AY80_9RHOB|nr:GNAT family N-acetyltransferase [Jannaschia seohaensis]PWJ16188.1 RimJ/RimL family protein N-acetyltransferase [Jannaschia seohaensis]SSA49201.1 Protein N-acetyltransferase, RimJ/RimL family [Jannaschia seohaensis]
MIPVLTTDRLTLRAPTLQDFEALAAFYASPRSRFVGGPLTRELAWRALAQEAGHWQLRGYGRWVVEAAGAPVGMVGLWFPEGFPEREIGWDLFDGHEGKGYATEAARAARAYAYDVLGWPTLVSLIRDGNDASARVAQRLGAAPDGRFTHERFGPATVWRHPAPSSEAAR